LEEDEGVEEQGEAEGRAEGEAEGEADEGARGGGGEAVGAAKGGQQDKDASAKEDDDGGKEGGDEGGKEGVDEECDEGGKEESDLRVCRNVTMEAVEAQRLVDILAAESLGRKKGGALLGNMHASFSSVRGGGGDGGEGGGEVGSWQDALTLLQGEGSQDDEGQTEATTLSVEECHDRVR
jgi:hypothetical protein